MHDIETYALAFSLSPMPLMLVDSDGMIALSNTAMDDLFEYTPGELVGQPVEMLVPEGNRAGHPALRNAFMKVPVKRGMGQGRDLYGYTRTGRTIPLELGLHPLDIDGKTWVMVTVTDITMRKSSEERIRLAMDATASAMVMVNHDGSIVFANQAAAKLFRYEPEELLSLTTEALVPETSRPVHSVYRHSFMQAGLSRRMAGSENIVARCKDGSTVPVEIGLTPLETPDGQMVMCTILDLTARHAHEAQVEEHMAQLDALNKDLSQFAYSASHDLKAPLASIAGLLRLCLEDLEEGDVQKAVSNLKNAVQITDRNKDKIEAVLKIAHVGREPIPVQPVDLPTMLDEVWLSLTAAMPDAPELRKKIAFDGPITAERMTLQLILENLLSNALRYRNDAKPEQWIKVEIKRVRDALTMTVADNGLGIATDSQHLVFEMFKRLDDRSNHGLGLSLVRKHLDRLGGTIHFSSTHGEGAEFHVCVPLTREDAA